MDTAQDDRFHLQRFIDAQSGYYSRVLSELRAGEKESHWMWFIFPQLRGLGHSDMALRYAIGGLDEARAFLDHSTLGARLRECTALVNGVQGRTLREIFGTPDDLKFHSCVTLFDVSSGEETSEFRMALERYFGGRGDQATISRL